MHLFTSFDVLVLELGLFGFIWSLLRSYISRIQARRIKATEFPLLQDSRRSKANVLPPTRSIKKQLEQTGKDVVIFYGSQTGTAERLASRLAKQAKLNYDLNCLVVDLEDYDYQDLQTLSSTQLAFFLLATCGDGEPTDNAIPFNHFLRDTEQKGTMAFSSLRYAAFGLGSSSYQFFNAMIRRLDQVLSTLGATRFGPLGLGDDGKGTLEDDFTLWSEVALAEVASLLRLAQIERKYVPSFEVKESAIASMDGVFVGEPNKSQLYQSVSGPFTANNPFPAKIMATRELFSAAGRNCVHVEFDTTGTTVGYDTGDHLAVWPTNSELEVSRFLRIFGLNGDNIVTIRSKDPSEKVPIPSPTTYAAACRHCLDTCASLSRQTLADLVPFSPYGPITERLRHLSDDKHAFHVEVTQRRLNLAQVLSLLSQSEYFGKVPFSFLLENIPKLTPRRYSISSSALSSKNTISITAVVDADFRKQSPTNPFPFQGVSTSYLIALHSHAVKKDAEQTHQLHLPRLTASSAAARPPTTPIHISRSKFRLPRHHTTPVIMIGPGTGVAPFRAFVQERAHLAKMGRTVGQMLLFYSCRSESEYLYKDEFENHRMSLPEVFEMYTAFSREDGVKKAYVQDLLVGHTEDLRRLVKDQGACVYVCGDAKRMAKDVARAFSQILGDDHVAAMRRDGKWSEDIW